MQANSPWTQHHGCCRSLSSIAVRFTAGWLTIVIGCILATVSFAEVPNNENPNNKGIQPNSIAETRKAVRDLAKIDDDNQFMAGFYSLLAKHHLVPILRQGNRLTIAAGAAIVLDRQGAVRLRNRDETVVECGTKDFMRGVTSSGQWIALENTAVRSLDALVVRSKTQIIIINLVKQTVSFVPSRPPLPRAT